MTSLNGFPSFIYSCLKIPLKGSQSASDLGRRYFDGESIALYGQRSYAEYVKRFLQVKEAKLKGIAHFFERDKNMIFRRNDRVFL